MSRDKGRPALPTPEIIALDCAYTLAYTLESYSSCMLVVYRSGWFCFVELLVNQSVSYEQDILSLGRVKVRRFGLPKPALQLTQATTYQRLFSPV